MVLLGDDTFETTISSSIFETDRPYDFCGDITFEVLSSDGNALASVFTTIPVESSFDVTL